VKYRLDDALAYASVAAIAAAIMLWLGALWIGEFSTRAGGVRELVRFGLLACGLSVVLVAASACRSLDRLRRAARRAGAPPSPAASDGPQAMGCAGGRHE
jgi:hypothetical protein